MKRLIPALMLILLLLSLVSCTSQNRSRGVYLLLDTSGTYADELNKARGIVNFMLGTLGPGDTLAVARIDTGSFSERDIIAKVTFDRRPSVSNDQKRAFQLKIDKFLSSINRSRYTDITGGVLQATEFLNETEAGLKHILIFSDLQEELKEGYVRDIPFQLQGYQVVAMNVTKLRSDIVDPREYMNRMEEWKTKVENGGGTFKVLNDLEHLEKLLD